MPQAGTDESTKVKKKVALKKKECRCLAAQLDNADYRKNSEFQVAELFSPPRFTLEVEKHGGKGLAFDIKQGWDLLNPKTPDQVERLLDRARPELFSCMSNLHAFRWLGESQPILQDTPGTCSTDPQEPCQIALLCPSDPPTAATGW